jgi:hypothetical protein
MRVILVKKNVNMQAVKINVNILRVIKIQLSMFVIVHINVNNYANIVKFNVKNSAITLMKFIYVKIQIKKNVNKCVFFAIEFALTINIIMMSIQKK